VDDDERMVRALERVFTSEGARVVCSSWAGGAIGILADRKIRVDLIIIDLCMPIISGNRAIYVIHKFYPKLPIVVLTAFASPTVRTECLRDGAAAFLEKPLDAAALTDAVRGALSSQEPAKNGGKKIQRKKGINEYEYHKKKRGRYVFNLPCRWRCDWRRGHEIEGGNA